MKKGTFDLSVKEGAPEGSFEDIMGDVNDALGKEYKNLWPAENLQYAPYARYTFPDKVIVNVGANYYAVPYVFDIDGNVTFGVPVKVEQVWVISEGASDWMKRLSNSFAPVKGLASELKEAGIEIIKEAVDMDFDLGEMIHVKEDSYNADTGEVEVVIIEAGTNPLKKRHYPNATIQEAASGFAGMKMYLNHPTAKEEKDMPERDITKWASTIVESRYDNGKAIGKVKIHDKWLKERLADPIARKHIGLSINTGGKVSYGKVDGQEMQIVEKIVMQRQNGPASVDWVTEAGARGRVSRLLKESSTIEGDDMKTLKECTFEDLQRENPALVESIIAKGKVTTADPAKDKELREAQVKIEQLEKTNKLRDQKEKISTMLKESKLPEISKQRVEADLVETLFESDVKLKEAFDVRHAKELDYVNKLSPKGKIVAGAASGGAENLRESLQGQLEGRMGIKTKEEDKEKK